MSDRRCGKEKPHSFFKDKYKDKDSTRLNKTQQDSTRLNKTQQDPENLKESA
jgi:hypothetical protein